MLLTGGAVAEIGGWDAQENSSNVAVANTTGFPWQLNWQPLYRSQTRIYLLILGLDF